MSDGWVRYLAYLPDSRAVLVRKSELPYWAAGIALFTFLGGAFMGSGLAIVLSAIMAGQAVLGANTTRRLVVCVSDPADADRFGLYRFGRWY
jgi:hypothetical protein